MRSVLVVIALLIGLQALTADAQSPPEPSRSDLEKRRFDVDLLEIRPAPDKATPPSRIDRSQTLFLQADNLVYDKNRVIAQGNVEIYYNNYILTADKVVYDETLNKMTAEGNAQLKDPNGQITRADVFEATDDFRDAFVAKLSSVTNVDPRYSTGPRNEGPSKPPE